MRHCNGLPADTTAVDINAIAKYRLGVFSQKENKNKDFPSVRFTENLKTYATEDFRAFESTAHQTIHGLLCGRDVCVSKR